MAPCVAQVGADEESAAGADRGGEGEVGLLVVVPAGAYIEEARAYAIAHRPGVLPVCTVYRKERRLVVVARAYVTPSTAGIEGESSRRITRRPAKKAKVEVIETPTCATHGARHQQCT